MDLTALKPFLDALGVSPAWYPVMICLGILNQYGKGMLRWWNANVSFGIAVLAGLGTAADSVYDHLQIGPAAIRGVVMAAAVLVTESVVSQAAKKVPFIPQDNEWAKGGSDAPKG